MNELLNRIPKTWHPSVTPPFRQHFQTSFSLKPLGQLNTNFKGELIKNMVGEVEVGAEYLFKLSISHSKMDGQNNI